MSPLIELIGGAKSYGFASLLAVGDYDSIATAVGTGSSGTITFSSIPSTYTHLQIRYIARDARGVTADSLQIQFNGDTGSNYMRYHLLGGDGTTATSEAGTTSNTFINFGNAAGASASANMYSAGVVDILDYSSTLKNKTTRTLDGFDFNGSGQANLWSGLWMSTAAINSITIVGATGANFTTATQFALYGIKGA
jgi:hypothetical protein